MMTLPEDHLFLHHLRTVRALRRAEQLRGLPPRARGPTTGRSTPATPGTHRRRRRGRLSGRPAW